MHCIAGYEYSTEAANHAMLLSTWSVAPSLQIVYNIV